MGQRRAAMRVVPSSSSLYAAEGGLVTPRADARTRSNAALGSAEQSRGRRRPRERRRSEREDAPPTGGDPRGPAAATFQACLAAPLWPRACASASLMNALRLMPARSEARARSACSCSGMRSSSLPLCVPDRLRSAVADSAGGAGSCGAPAASIRISVGVCNACDNHAARSSSGPNERRSFSSAAVRIRDVWL